MRQPLIFILLFTPLLLQCQTDLGKLDYQCSVPNFLYENSGMELEIGQNQIYMINDSGNANSVYAIDATTGEMKREIAISNAQNKDWEDLTLFNGDLFIGDFGNNKNDRKNLVIYWVSDINSYKNVQNTAFAKTISFSFEDQSKFPPKKKKRNFDVEAFMAKDDALYLFTRNRSSKFDGTVKCYKLAIKEGQQLAKLVGSYSFCDDWPSCQITAADYHAASNTIALLSYDKVWLLNDFKGDNFFMGQITTYHLGHTSQKEALCFKDARTLYLGEESKKNVGGAVYQLQLTH